MTARFLAGVIIGVLLFFAVLSMLSCTSVNVQVGTSNMHDKDGGLVIVKPVIDRSPPEKKNDVKPDARNDDGKHEVPPRH